MTVTNGAAGFSTTSLTVIFTVIVSSMMVSVMLAVGSLFLCVVEAVPDLHLNGVGAVRWGYPLPSCIVVRSRCRSPSSFRGSLVRTCPVDSLISNLFTQLLRLLYHPLS